MSAKASASFFVIITLMLGGSASAGLRVRQLSRPFAVGDSSSVRIEAPFGHLTTETWGDDSVAVELELECSGEVGPCRDAAARVALSSSRTGEALVIRIVGPWTAEDKERSKTKTLKARGWHLAAKIRIFYPASRHIEVYLETGAAEVRGLESDARIRVDRGSATVTMKQRDAGSLKLSCDQGDAVIRSLGEPPLRGKKSLEWHEGNGECDLEVELGEGEIVVDLL